MSYNNAGEIEVASELMKLTMDIDDAVVRPKAAQAELVVCVRMVRWCTTVARLRQGWLGGGSD